MSRISSVDFNISAETSSVDFSISAEGGNFVFRAIPSGTTAFLCATHFTPPWSKICDWVTQIYNKKHVFQWFPKYGLRSNKGCDFTKGQQISRWAKPCHPLSIPANCGGPVLSQGPEIRGEGLLWA